MVTKTELRARMMQERADMSPDDVTSLSDRIISNLLGLEEVIKASSFFIYVSIDNEVQTYGLIKILLERGKIVTVPKVFSSGYMEAYQITDLNQLKEGGIYDIPYPTTKGPYKGKLDVCIAPSVAVTEQLHRLGRGGGYYDKFLKKNPMPVIALAYNSQIVHCIPNETSDISVNIIVTEDSVIR